jgi:Holliday junction resolvasome RuvABC endonuclease subunit
MRFMSIDQATERFAFCIFDDDNLFDEDKLILYKYFDLYSLFGKDSLLELRIDTVRAIMVKYIEEYNVEFVALEDIYLNTFGNAKFGYKSFKNLAMLLGVLQNELHQRNMLYFTVKPAEWRKTCKIKGKKGVQKEEAIQFVLDNFDVPNDIEEDSAECICMGWHVATTILPKIISSSGE